MNLTRRMGFVFVLCLGIFLVFGGACRKQKTELAIPGAEDSAPPTNEEKQITGGDEEIAIKDTTLCPEGALDTDADGLCDESDNDDDGDGILDEADLLPLAASVYAIQAISVEGAETPLRQYFYQEFEGSLQIQWLERQVDGENVGRILKKRIFTYNSARRLEGIEYFAYNREVNELRVLKRAGFIYSEGKVEVLFRNEGGVLQDRWFQIQEGQELTIGREDCQTGECLLRLRVGLTLREDGQVLRISIDDLDAREESGVDELTYQYYVDGKLGRVIAKKGEEDWDLVQYLADSLDASKYNIYMQGQLDRPVEIVGFQKYDALGRVIEEQIPALGHEEGGKGGDGGGDFPSHIVYEYDDQGRLIKAKVTHGEESQTVLLQYQQIQAYQKIPLVFFDEGLAQFYAMGLTKSPFFQMILNDGGSD